MHRKREGFLFLGVMKSTFFKHENSRYQNVIKAMDWIEGNSLDLKGEGRMMKKVGYGFLRAKAQATS